jgi:dTDP-4-amino-4,6-dideoxygalactose transaminase
MTAVAEVLDSGSLILGPRVRRFEENFARFLGVPGEAVGVANGTDALAIALRALEVGTDDEVLTVANTAIPTVSAIRMAGATPVFCDIDPQSLLVDLNDAARRLTPRTRAIIVVHLFGNAAAMPAVLDFAARHQLRVIEDCAQATGTTLHGRQVGTFGDVGCFSFYPTKNLGAFGDGGLCFARDRELAEQIRRIRMYGCAATYYSEREGVNSRLDELQAAMLDVKLRYLNEHLSARRAVAAVYNAHLDNHVGHPQTTPGVDPSYHLYVVTTDRREPLIAKLQQQQIGHGIHYPTPIHLMRGYQFLGYRPGSLPVTERMAKQVLSLPCYPELPLSAVMRVADVVNSLKVMRRAA